MMPDKIICIGCEKDLFVFNMTTEFAPYSFGFRQEFSAKCPHCNIQFEISGDAYDDFLKKYNCMASFNHNCSHCGSPDVVIAQFENDLFLCTPCANAIMGPRLKPIPSSAKKKHGCKKCSYTGFAYGKIPCECTDGKP